MARYNLIYGPAANLTFNGALQFVPGMEVTRYWDNGEVLIQIHLYWQAPAGAALLSYDVVFDTFTAIPPGTTVQDSAPAAAVRVSGRHYLHSISEGYHRYQLRVNGTNGGTLFARGSALTLIQLPVWDDAANLINL